jgi:iron complex transport system substrate-binding protein
MSAWMPSDPRMQLLTELGFEPNPEIAALDEGDFFIAISPERIDLMEADTVFIAALDGDGNVSSDLEKNKLFQGLDAVSSGRVGYFPGPPTILSSTPAGNFSSAFSIGGALGIPACLDELTATLATAVAGDGPAKAAF